MKFFCKGREEPKQWATTSLSQQRAIVATEPRAARHDPACATRRPWACDRQKDFVAIENALSRQCHAHGWACARSNSTITLSVCMTEP